MKEIEYTIVNELLSKESINKKFGNVSFAYINRVNDMYQIKAVSSFEQQYLKAQLLIDKIDFAGVDTVQELEYFSGVI